MYSDSPQSRHISRRPTTARVCRGRGGLIVKSRTTANRIYPERTLIWGLFTPYSQFLHESFTERVHNTRLMNRPLQPSVHRCLCKSALFPLGSGRLGTESVYDTPVMNRLLSHTAHRSLGTWVRCAASLAGLVLVIETSGCASHRPAPVLVQPQAVGAPMTDPEGGLSLTLVTYNIWGLPSWMTGAPSGRYPRIARALERLDPDIILLQEAWTSKARKAAPASGRWSVARAAGQHTFFQQNGLVTLSKFPIIGGEFYPFSRAAFPDRFVNKGVMKVTVQLPGGRLLNIWNVHMQEGGRPELRLSQIRELVSHVEAAEDGQIADLVGGDFNCTPESCFCRELTSALGPTVQQLSGADPFVTWDGLSSKPGKGETIDYIFIKARTPLEDLRAVPHLTFTAPTRQQRLSDHFGIEAVVNLSPAPSLAGAPGPLPRSHSSPAAGVSRTAYAGRE